MTCFGERFGASTTGGAKGIVTSINEIPPASREFDETFELVLLRTCVQDVERR
jgi:hypothetical protein